MGSPVTIETWMVSIPVQQKERNHASTNEQPSEESQPEGKSWMATKATHRPAQPLLAAFSAVFLAAPQLVALAERAPAGLVAGAVFLGGLQSSYWDATWTTAIIVAARRGAKYFRWVVTNACCHRSSLAKQERMP